MVAMQLWGSQPVELPGKAESGESPAEAPPGDLREAINQVEYDSISSNSQCMEPALTSVRANVLILCPLLVFWIVSLTWLSRGQGLEALGRCVQEVAASFPGGGQAFWLSKAA